MSIVPCPEEARSLSDIDRGLAEDHRLRRCEEMSSGVEKRDRDLFAAHSRICPECGGPLESKGRGEPTVCAATCMRHHGCRRRVKTVHNTPLENWSPRSA